MDNNNETLSDIEKYCSDDYNNFCANYDILCEQYFENKYNIYDDIINGLIIGVAGGLISSSICLLYSKLFTT